MYRTISTLTLAACIAPCLAEGMWIHDNFDLARKQAAEQGKGILIEFTGSDWCMPCAKLRREVLTQAAFEAEAARHFVLLELDYPRQKPQPAEVKEANRKLADAYGIEAFPTIVFADAQGRPLDSFVGFKAENSVRAYMDNALAREQLVRDACARAFSGGSEQKTMANLNTILRTVPEAYHNSFYANLKEKLKSLDKEDRYGYRAADERKARVARQMEAVKAYFRTHLGPHTDPQEALDIVKRCPNRDKAEPEVLQEILVTEWQCTLSATGDADAGIALLDRVIALNPDSRLGREAVELRELTDRQRTIIWQRYMDYQERRKQK